MTPKESDYLIQVGERIKVLREKHGFSQRLLASHLGIDERHLRRIEKGQTNPTILLLLAIAEYLETDLGSLASSKKG